MAYKPECPYCKKRDQAEIPRKRKSDEGYCKRCTSWFNVKQAPRILELDIETSQMELRGKLFDTKYEQRLNHKWIEKDWYIITWQAKWLFSPETFGEVVTPKESVNRDDRRIVEKLHKIMSKADFIITHNGDKFDLKKINWRFLIHELTPQRNYQSIDTLQKCKEVFGASSMAMEFLCRQLGYEQKHHTNIELWNRCEAGDKEALKQMADYCANDIYMLEDLYTRTRPFYKAHPNFAVFFDFYDTLDADEYQCHVCGEGIHNNRFSKKWRTPAGYEYKSCNCPHCGTMIRKTFRERVQFIKSR